MSEFDADSATVAGEESTVSEAATVTERVLGRNVFVFKAAAFFVVMFGFTHLAHWAASSPEARQLTAIGKWFTVIFAVGGLGLALVVNVVGAIQRRRRGV